MTGDARAAAMPRYRAAESARRESGGPWSSAGPAPTRLNCPMSDARHAPADGAPPGAAAPNGAASASPEAGPSPGSPASNARRKPETPAVRAELCHAIRAGPPRQCPRRNASRRRVRRCRPLGAGGSGHRRRRPFRHPHRARHPQPRRRTTIDGHTLPRYNLLPSGPSGRTTRRAGGFVRQSTRYCRRANRHRHPRRAVACVRHGRSPTNESMTVSP